MNKYANKYGFASVEPHEVVEGDPTTDRKVLVRPMKFELDPEFVPDWRPGGFAAHLANCAEQKWIITTSEIAEPFWITRRSNGLWVRKGSAANCGEEFCFSDAPKKYYDFNF